MKTLAIGRLTVVRYFRDRAAFFTVFVLPLMIVLLLGAASGGASVPKLGFSATTPDTLTSELLASLESVEGLQVTVMGTQEAAIRGVERGDLQAAIILPAGYEQTLRAGGDAQIRFVTRESPTDQGITGVINAAVTQQATLLRTARFVDQQEYGTFDEGLTVADEAQANLPPVAVQASTAGEPFALAGLGQFDIYAQGMLVLFIFMTTLTAGATMVQTRALGVARRMFSTPTSVRTMILGEALGRLGLALLQGAFIFLGTWLLFGVDWGDPVGAAVTILAFSVVASAAAMLLGSVARNEQQASGLSWAFGIGLAALGGCMFPLAALEVLSDTVYTVAHVTPHAWALESFQALVVDDGGLADITGFLGILLGYAAVLFLLATWRLRAVLVR